MNVLKTFLAIAALGAAVVHAQAQEFAPANVSNMIFNGTVAGGSGGAAASGAFSSLLASNGVDYSLSGGGLSDPVAYTYQRNSGTSATITEAASGAIPSVSVSLTFTAQAAGTFVATYGNGGTQNGSFTLVPIGFASPLLNVSARTTIAANGSAITGFVVGGNGPRRVLIRAVGPGLAPFGVTGALANPRIMLWRGSTQIGGNDDYASGANVDASLPATFTSVGAFSLPANSRDAALVTSLEPGAYTAQIMGGSATESGEVLLEVYFLD